MCHECSYKYTVFSNINLCRNCILVRIKPWLKKRKKRTIDMTRSGHETLKFCFYLFIVKFRGGMRKCTGKKRVELMDVKSLCD